MSTSALRGGRCGRDDVGGTAAGSRQQGGLADAMESGGSECLGIDEPAHPAEAAQGVRLVVDAPQCGEDPGAEEVPLLDFVVVILEVAPEAVEIVAETLLDEVEPCLIRIEA